LIELLLTCRT